MKRVQQNILKTKKQFDKIIAMARFSFDRVVKAALKKSKDRCEDINRNVKNANIAGLDGLSDLINEMVLSNESDNNSRA